MRSWQFILIKNETTWKNGQASIQKGQTDIYIYKRTNRSDHGLQKVYHCHQQSRPAQGSMFCCLAVYDVTERYRLPTESYITWSSLFLQYSLSPMLRKLNTKSKATFWINNIYEYSVETAVLFYQLTHHTFKEKFSVKYLKMQIVSHMKCTVNPLQTTVQLVNTVQKYIHCTFWDMTKYARTVVSQMERCLILKHVEQATNTVL